MGWGPTPCFANEEADEIRVQELIKKVSSRLGPFQDPFVLVYDGEKADALFQRLCVREVKTGAGTQWKESPLGQI